MAAIRNIHNACCFGDVEAIEQFITAGGSVELRGTVTEEDDRYLDLWCYSSTLLGIACECNHIDIAKLLLEEGASPSVGTDSDERLPLHHACSWNYIEIVKLLLKYQSGTSINARDASGSTPLHNACWCQSADCAPHCRKTLVQMLLDVGARVNVFDASSNTPLKLALRRDDPDTVRLLLENGAIIGDMCVYGTMSRRTFIDCYEGKEEFRHLEIAYGLVQEWKKLEQKNALIWRSREFRLRELSESNTATKGWKESWRLCLLPDEMVGIVLGYSLIIDKTDDELQECGKLKIVDDDREDGSVWYMFSNDCSVWFMLSDSDD